MIIMNNFKDQNYFYINSNDGGEGLYRDRGEENPSFNVTATVSFTEGSVMVRDDT